MDRVISKHNNFHLKKKWVATSGSVQSGKCLKMRPGLERYLIFYCALKIHWKHGQVLLKISILPWIFFNEIWNLCFFFIASTWYVRTLYMQNDGYLPQARCGNTPWPRQYGRNFTDYLPTSFLWMKALFFYGYFIVNLFQGILLIIGHYFFWFHNKLWASTHTHTSVLLLVLMSNSSTHTHAHHKYSYSYS